MTIIDVSMKYNIPIDILKMYEKWNICNENNIKKEMGQWQYDDSDLDRLGVIMTLYNVGFDNDEIEHYMKLYVKGKSTSQERSFILRRKRSEILDKIHLYEKNLEDIDYLKYKLE